VVSLKIKTPGRLPGDFYLPNLYLKVDCYSHYSRQKYCANGNPREDELVKISDGGEYLVAGDLPPHYQSGILEISHFHKSIHIFELDP
jgi:hypothetical protein